MIDHNKVSQQINELEMLTAELIRGHSYKSGEARIAELLGTLEAQCDDLVKNDRKSLILLQRQQRAVGRLIVDAPHWLFHQGLLEKAVRLSPDPAQLGEAIRIGLFQMMLGQAEQDKGQLALGLEAVRLGGMVGSGLKIMSNGYGFMKDKSPAFVPWHSTAAQKRLGAIANEFLMGLLHNTLEHSYDLDSSTLTTNLNEITAGLMYFGGEAGCRSALEMLPIVVQYMDAGRYEKEDGEFSDEDLVSRLLIENFEKTCSTNTLHTLKEHCYPVFLRYVEDFAVTYRIGNAIKAGEVDFDITVLPVESEVAKKAVVENVNLVFCSDYDIGIDDARRMLKMLGHFGLRGEELRLAATNSHLSSILQWALDACLAGGGVESLMNVKPRDVVAQNFEFGAEAAALYREFAAEHVNGLDALLDFLVKNGTSITRNGLVVGAALKDPRVDAIVSDLEAMTIMSACTLYSYGSDAKSPFGIERESFSALEIAGIAGRIKKCFEEKDKLEPWAIRKRFNSGVLHSLAMCADHPDTKAAMEILSPDAIAQFNKVFDDWFTREYQQSIQWSDHRFKAARLEDELGM